MLQFEKPPIDARCAIILLLLSNVIAFTQKSLWVEIGLLLLLSLLLIFCGCGKQAFKWGCFFGGCLLIQSILLPKINFSFTAGFAVMFSYARKMLPCLMVGTVIVKKIPSQYLILALRKFHVPQIIMIPFSVTIRYIPSLKTEYQLVRDAMKLRNISKTKRLECVIVSFNMNAASTADELSAAAVTRGIENPCIKSSVFEMKFGIMDFVFISICSGFMILSFLSMGGIL